METDRDRRIIASLLDVFAARKAVALLDTLVADDLVCHMDRVSLRLKREGLRTWFQYMHATMRRRRIVVDVNIGRIDEAGSGRYDVRGTVVARRRDNTAESRRFAVAYLVEQGRVAGVWSTRTNYVGVVGRSILFPMYLGYLYHCVRAWGYRVAVTSRQAAVCGNGPRMDP